MKNTLFFLAVPSLAAAAGCYKNAGPNALAVPTSDYLSQSSCQALCASHKFPVAATRAGAECACAAHLPHDSDQVADDHCDVVCPGYPTQKCKPPMPLDGMVCTNKCRRRQTSLDYLQHSLRLVLVGFFYSLCDPGLSLAPCRSPGFPRQPLGFGLVLVLVRLLVFLHALVGL